jgi:hypothetical protein
MNADRKPRAGETGTLIGVRLQATPLVALDAYGAQQPDPEPSRLEMSRTVLEEHLREKGYLPR